jgi:NADH-quinone oxidoreductase subunit N
MVLSEVATDGRYLKIAELAGIYRRSPLLMMSLILGVFALAAISIGFGFCPDRIIELAKAAAKTLL